MSDFLTTTQDATAACIATFETPAGKGVRRASGRGRGQTAAEYMGVLLVVAVIIAAVVDAPASAARSRTR